MIGLIRQQPYSATSVDGSLLLAQTLLTSENRESLYGMPPAPPQVLATRPELEACVSAARGGGSHPLAIMLALTRWCGRIPLNYPANDGSTIDGHYGDFRGFRFGGSEEAIIAKGSPWPQELARVLAALLQVAGIPSRLVFLYRERPPAFHSVVEAYLRTGWAVCDPSASRCYVWPHRGYASALDLQQHPRLVDQAPEHGRNPYVDSSLYAIIGIADYALGAEPAPESDLTPAGDEDRARLQAAAQVFSATQ